MIHEPGDDICVDDIAILFNHCAEREAFTIYV